MNLVNAILGQTFLHNSILQWLGAVIVAIVIYLSALYARHLTRKSYEHYTQAERTDIIKVPLNVVSRTTTLFILIVALFAGSVTLEMPDKLSKIVKSILTIALFWQAGVWASAATLTWIENKRKINLMLNRAAVGTLGILGVVLRVLIWALVLLLVLDNLGVNITALVAGLGIGGVAVALAVQNVLGDLLASISITLDKPFVIGDSVSLDDFTGRVEHVGIKSTRLRSVSGELIVMSNADLLKGRLRNYGRSERRVMFELNVAYETPITKLKRIPDIVKSIIEAQPDTRFDQSHFVRFGAASLDFETVYYVLSFDRRLYLDIQHEINFRILEAFEHEGIEFAYPTQKLWLARIPSRSQNSGI